MLSAERSGLGISQDTSAVPESLPLSTLTTSTSPIGSFSSWGRCFASTPSTKGIGADAYVSMV